MTKLYSNKWIILLVVTLVSFITNVDSTIVIIGLPKLMQGLNMSIEIGLLSITSYIIASTVLLLPAGRWADIIGTKKVFLLGFSIFTIGTALCGFATSGTSLILYRVVQGAGAALALATATPIILKTFPENQLGLALGINATSWVIGALIGPIAGGALIGSCGWRSIFFVTVPFGVIGIIGAAIVLADNEAIKKTKTDWLGILTFGLGLSALMVALSKGQSWGWASAPVLELFAATFILWGIFLIIELRIQHPLFNLRLFSYRKYSLGLGITFSYCVAYFSIPLLLSIYLQGALNLDAMTASLLMISLSVPQLVMGPLGGKLTDRFGAERMIIIGLIFLIIGMFSLGQLGSSLNRLSVVIPLVIMSVANGIAWPSIAKTVLSAAPQEQAGSASGMFYTVYNVGRALSQTLAILVIEFTISPAMVTKAIVGMADFANIQANEDLIRSIDSSFYFFIIFFAIALLLGLILLYQNQKETLKNKQKKEICIYSPTE
ncbi:MAG: MFS transporter [Firmicutes bacterium]|nr:MFS transporter [Bacillota bacterium]